MQAPARLYVACDVSNLIKSCRGQYGEDARLDFGLLSTVLPALLHPKLVQQTLTAYVVTHNKTSKGGHAMFMRALSHYGWQVKTRDMAFAKVEKTSWMPTRSDWDVGITVDAIHNVDSYDTYVLMSGDGDFVTLLEYLKQRGKQVIVMTFESSASKKLYEVADTLIPFTDLILLRK